MVGAGKRAFLADGTAGTKGWRLTCAEKTQFCMSAKRPAKARLGAAVQAGLGAWTGG